jgi:hypothetical protein
MIRLDIREAHARLEGVREALGAAWLSRRVAAIHNLLAVEERKLVMRQVRAATTSSWSSPCD